MKYLHERVAPKCHKKPKGKKILKPQHIKDKLKALKVEQDMYRKWLKPSNSMFLRDVITRRLAQIAKRIELLTKEKAGE